MDAIKASKLTPIARIITDFLQHCQYEKNLTSKTIYAYRSDLNMFLHYLHASYPLSLSLEQVSKEIIKEYMQHLFRYKPKTVKRKLASLKALFNYYDYEHDNFLNPFRKLRIRFKEPLVLPTVMTCHEIKNILKYLYQARSSNPHPDAYLYKAQTRDIAVIELLFATGIRVSELCGLSCHAVDLRQATVRIFGKGGKERIIQLCSPDVIKILRQYQLLFQPCDSFFVNRLGSPLSPASVRALVKRCRTEIGMNKKITPHTFRHTFATLLLEEDVDIKYIQNLLGHSSITTTQIYTHVNIAKQRQLLSTKHPRRLIDLE